VATNALATGTFTPTREMPLWINRTKQAKVQEGKTTSTFTTDAPVVLSMPDGSLYALPAGGIIVGKYFENCRDWKALQPLFITVERSKIHDPLNLLSAPSGEDESLTTWKGQKPTGEPTVYSKTVAEWRLYFRDARDEQISQELNKRRVLRRVAEFCGVKIDDEQPHVDNVKLLRNWALSK